MVLLVNYPWMIRFIWRDSTQTKTFDFVNSVNTKVVEWRDLNEGA